MDDIFVVMLVLIMTFLIVRPCMQLSPICCDKRPAWLEGGAAVAVVLCSAVHGENSAGLGTVYGQNDGMPYAATVVFAGCHCCCGKGL
jgi:hypothetical protein